MSKKARTAVSPAAVATATCAARSSPGTHITRARRPPGLVGGASLHQIEPGKRNAAVPHFRIGHSPHLHHARLGVPPAPIGVGLPGAKALAALFSGFPVQQNLVNLNSPNDRASQLILMRGEVRQFRHNSQKSQFTPTWPSMNALYSACSVQGWHRQHQRGGQAH